MGEDPGGGEAERQTRGRLTGRSGARRERETKKPPKKKKKRQQNGTHCKWRHMRNQNTALGMSTKHNTNTPVYKLHWEISLHVPLAKNLRMNVSSWTNKTETVSLRDDLELSTLKG